MELIFHIPYLILVPSTVIFWIQRLLKQGYVAPRLKLLQTFYGRHELLTLRKHLDSTLSCWWGQCCSYFWFSVFYYLLCLSSFGSLSPLSSIACRIGFCLTFISICLLLFFFLSFLNILV